jgi:hypothetical protein
VLNQKIKEEFKVLSIFGGPHPTICPEMIYQPGVDGICIGEGEHALLENNLSKAQIIFDSDTIKKAKIKLRISGMLGIPYGSLK